MKQGSLRHSRAHFQTVTDGPRTVPVRSSIAGGTAQECSRPPRPSDVLRAGTARARAPERVLGRSGESPLSCGEESWGIEA